MIVFKLLSFQFMCDNDTLNWATKTLTINSNIDFLYLTINNYTDYTYNINNINNIEYSCKSKKNKSIKLEHLFNYKSMLEYFNATIKDYSKAFTIHFEELELNTDYILAPLYITETTIYIGIILLNPEIIKSINSKSLNYETYSLLSKINHYECKNKVNCNNYNFINGILIKNNSNITKNKEFVLDKHKKILLNNILQNSINYIPNLEIIRIKKNFQNRLNP
jgi:hypothetical protein